MNGDIMKYWKFVPADGPRWMPFAWRTHSWVWTDEPDEPTLDDQPAESRRLIERVQDEPARRGLLSRLLASVKWFFVGPDMKCPGIGPGIMVGTDIEETKEHDSQRNLDR